MDPRVVRSAVLPVLGLSLCLSLLVGCARPQKSEPKASVARQAPIVGQPPAVSLRQVGSTTMLPLAERWRSEFSRLNPGVSLTVSGGGSSGGLQALIGHTAEIADSSRPITPGEMKKATAAGAKPVQHLVARDGIAVIVNPANPLTEISLQRLSDLYVGKLTKWDSLGARGLGQVQVIDRDASSGTREVFRKLVVTLGGKSKARDYAPGVLNQVSSQAALALVGQTKSAIGYVGLGYVDSTVKVLKISPAEGKPAVAPADETVLAGTYPLSRGLYCYTNGEPSGEQKTYLDWIQGPAGQAIVSELGFVPLKGQSGTSGGAR